MRRLLLLVVGAVLAGCAGTPVANSNDHSVSLPDHSDSDTPPPTLSGYVETSYTKQIR